jgi:hypothetical protein
MGRIEYGGGIKTHPAGRIVHGKSLPAFKTNKFLFIPFVQIGQYFGQSDWGVRTFPAIA